MATALSAFHCANIESQAAQSDKAKPRPFPFLSLPSKIRNVIYALLYEYDEPLHIVELDHAPGKIVLHQYESSDRTNILGGKLWFARIALHKLINSTVPEHVEAYETASLASNLSLFYACRQVCEEASSVLSKNNTFTFIRMYSQKPTECDREGHHLTRVAVPWLRRLGSRVLMVHHVTIDAGRTCPSRCAGDLPAQRSSASRVMKTAIDASPLICTIQRLDLKLHVTLVQSPHIGKQLQATKRLSEPPPVPDSNMLTALTRSIIRDDFNLRRYERLIDSIFINTTKLVGLVNLPTPR